MSSAWFIAFMIAAVLLGGIIALTSGLNLPTGDDGESPLDRSAEFGSGYEEQRD